MAAQDETVALPPTPPPTPPPSSHIEPHRFAPGQLLAARYRIVSLLGKGGMGEVYRADDLTLGQSVALKFLPPGAANERFRNEVKIARQVSHPNVCRVYDVGEIDGQWFLSMEYVDGEDLGSLLRRIGRLPSDKALEISRKLCAGLAAAHEKGVLHRDLKPGNVMLDGRGQVLLTDFGLAALAGEVEGAEIRSGTPAYMAPEQLAGHEVTIRSDIYSLGLVIYEIFTGKRPYESDTLAGLQKLQSQSAPASMTSLVRDLDPLVERVILRCLEAEPSKRPASAISVAAALPGGDPLAAALAAGDTPSPQMVAAAGEGRGLHPKWAIALLVVAVLGVVGNAVLVSRGSVLDIMHPEYSPDVLRVKARDILAQLGYAGRPADNDFGFQWNESFLNWVDSHEKPVDWQKVLAQPPSGYSFWYRQSPYNLTGVLFHNDLLTPGIVELGDPPSTMSGITNVMLDPEGRLRYLQVVPPQRATPPTTAVVANWDALFKAAGMERSQFQEAAPEWTFLVASDERKAWTGVWTGTKRPLRVEAAMFQGKPVGFQLIADWTKPTHMPPPDSTDERAKIIAAVLLGIFVIFGSALVARRNLRLGKGDRDGATRLASIVFTLLLLIWASQVHLAFSLGLVGTLFVAIATAAGWAVVMWTVYIAVEPFVRRYWPQSIMSWSSITVGNWRDPIVGRDVLAGIALGISWRLIDRALDFAVPSGPPGMVQAAILDGFRATVGAVLTKGYYGIRSAVVFFFLLFLMRLLLRKQSIAAVAFVVVFSLLGAMANDHFWVAWAVNALVYVLIVISVVRLGLLALAAAVFTADGALLMVALYGSGWYVWNSVFCVVVIVALAVWACRTAMAGQSIWKTDLLG